MATRFVSGHHDYRRRGDVVESRCIAPLGSPEWSMDPQALWNACEVAEKRKDATVCREFEIALPHELDDSQRLNLVTDICFDLVGRYGFAMQASIHAPPIDGGLNHHAHLLATTRRMTPDGLAGKTRELDGGASGRVEVEWIRQMVANRINQHLNSASIDARVDHRSLEAQAAEAIERGDPGEAIKLMREPTKHAGKDATALHRRGRDSRIIEENAEIAASNEAQHQELLRQLHAEGRLQPTSNGHSHAQALKDAGKHPGNFMPLGRDSMQGEIQLGQGARKVVEAKTHGLDATEAQKIVRVMFDEAASLFSEPFVATVGVGFEQTSKVIRHRNSRVLAHAMTRRFQNEVRDFLKLMKRLKHAALRFTRRMSEEEQARRLLHDAEMELELFDDKNAGILSPKEYANRRATRLTVLRERQKGYQKARAATSSEAQVACVKETDKVAHELEEFSRRMLTRFPVDADFDEGLDTTPNIESQDSGVKYEARKFRLH
ncbi:MAG: MobA/MobL family protein [Proteobacteria bacterium]|nr:MobA/MobL family protein [Pseudomonadota bacterium]